jgi:hypothetical protein
MGTDKENAMILMHELLDIIKRDVPVREHDSLPSDIVLLVGVPGESLHSVVAKDNKIGRDFLYWVGRPMRDDAGMPVLPRPVWLHADVIRSFKEGRWC